MSIKYHPLQKKASKKLRLIISTISIVNQLTIKDCGAKISAIKALGDSTYASNAAPWAIKLANANGLSTFDSVF